MGPPPTLVPRPALMLWSDSVPAPAPSPSLSLSAGTWSVAPQDGHGHCNPISQQPGAAHVPAHRITGWFVLERTHKDHPVQATDVGSDALTRSDVLTSTWALAPKAERALPCTSTERNHLQS